MTAALTTRQAAPSDPTPGRRRVIRAIHRRIDQAEGPNSAHKRLLKLVGNITDWGCNPAGCYMSNRRIAEELGLSVPYVKKLVRELVDLGWLAHEHNPIRRPGSGYRALHLGPEALRLALPRVIGAGDTPVSPAEAPPASPVAGGLPTGALGSTTTTNNGTPESSSMIEPPGPGDPPPATAPAADIHASEPATPTAPRIAPGTDREPAAEPAAIDAAPLARLTARLVALAGLSAAQAEAKIRRAAADFPAEWLEPAIDAAAKVRPKDGPWHWGIVVGVLRNFRAEGGPPAARPGPARARMRRAREKIDELGRRGRILVVDGGSLRVEPRDPDDPPALALPDDLRAELVDLKPELLELLGGRVP
ncbi:hypothetical protein OJF2_79300 (plasmid) [Aquisphaera giovannonii]|uniref:Uncharacterized protein n=1 Tax=Aquisphaera giovannonii TaxID=406548 RepID=A0A5B9WH71_9BACT|nr:helix-turn-helix domain-containing protein [Aquisphaera giovannonii]QEH39315.1 hypothetical protein OJF2_79300 [Aquisphaera giovannonii]